MLWCQCCSLNSSQIESIESAVSASNLMQILQHCRKLMEIRCQKGAGTKLQKCLVVLEKWEGGGALKLCPFWNFLVKFNGGWIRVSILNDYF